MFPLGRKKIVMSSVSAAYPLSASECHWDKVEHMDLVLLEEAKDGFPEATRAQQTLCFHSADHWAGMGPEQFSGGGKESPSQAWV